ncbi:MAG: uridylate kinase [Methanothrix sp.]|nr:uridylate kinase [Methanothrix sp.]MDD4446748.1 uridylate kinase [Methanothrix sp.]
MGGSLMTCARSLMAALLALAVEGNSFLVVPGGGPMADLVRDIYSRGHLSQEAAHWMAVLAMEQYAYFLADGNKAVLTREICRPKKDCSVQVLLPYHVLIENDRGLLHNWDYTSDAVAALVAAQLSAPLIKATDVDGVMLDGKVVSEVPANRMRGHKSCVDQGTIDLLCGPLKGNSIWVLNGTDVQQFCTALKSKEGGTIIKG